MGYDQIGQKLPPLPPGFVLEEQMPPLPEGFVLEGEDTFGKAAKEQMMMYPPEPRKSGILKQVGKVGASIGESALQLGTGLTALVPAAGAGLYEAWKTGGRGQPWQKAEEAYGKATYQPKTKEGQKITETFMGMTPLKLINDTTEVAASYAPNEEAKSAIRLGGGLLLATFMGKYGHMLSKGEPVFGRDFKNVAKDVPNLPDELWKEIESVPDESPFYLTRLEEMAKTSGGKGGPNFSEMPRTRQIPGEYGMRQMEKVFEAIPEEAAFKKSKKLIAKKVPPVPEGFVVEEKPPIEQPSVTPEPTKPPIPTPSISKEPWQIEKGEMEELVRSAGLRIQGAKDALKIRQPQMPEFPKPEGKIIGGGELLPQKQYPERLMSINLNRVGPEGIRDWAYDTLRRNQVILEEKRGGPLPDVELRKAAKELEAKVPIERLVAGLYEKTKDMGKAVLAARYGLNDLKIEMEKAAKMAADNPTIENQAKSIYMQRMAENTLLTMTFPAREWGRAGRAFKEIAEAQGQFATGNYAEALRILKRKGLDNPANIERLKLLDPNNPYEIVKLLKSVIKPKLREKLYEIWINFLLSSPVTHTTNISSNSVTVGSMPVETLGAGIMSKVGGLINPTLKDVVLLGEAPHQIVGFFTGFPEAVRKSLSGLLRELPPETSKLEMATRKAVGGKLGEAIRTPGRALEAADQFFMALAYSMDTRGQAYRMAALEKKAGGTTPILKRMSEILEDLPEGLRQHAIKEAEYRMFHTPLEGLPAKFLAAKGQHVTLGVIFPFVRTPYNIVKYALERTPLETVRIAKRVTASGLNKIFGTGFEGMENMTPEQVVQMASRAAIGMAVATGIAMLVGQGKITGTAPDDPGERDAFYREGKQPRSIKIGNKWYTYGRLQPPGITLGFIADVYDLLKNKVISPSETSHIMGRLARIMAQNITNNTFTRGMSDVMNAIQDPERYGKTWVQSLMGSTVPTGVAELARNVDPTIRDMQNTLDVFKARIPGLSKELPARRDVWGEEIKRPSAPGGRSIGMVSPIRVSPVKTNPVDEELNRLGVYLGMPSKKFGKEKLSGEEYSQFAEAAGKGLYAQLLKLIQSPSFQKASDKIKKDVISRVVDSYRRTVRAPILQQKRQVE